MGRRSEAIDVLEAATELAPGELLPLRILGHLLARSSKPVQAEHVLRRVRLLDPDNSKACNDHAVILMRLHRHAEARAILQDVLDRYGPDVGVLCNLANATTCVGEQTDGGSAHSPGQPSRSHGDAAAPDLVQHVALL